MMINLTSQMWGLKHREPPGYTEPQSAPTQSNLRGCSLLNHGTGGKPVTDTGGAGRQENRVNFVFNTLSLK